MNAQHSTNENPIHDRRRFLTLAVLGGGASLLLRPATGAAARGTDALLLSCIDYRLIEKTERYMSKRGMRGKYDQVVLAGAALAAITDKYPAWNQTFWEHLDVAIKLHNIHTVIALDHRDCGAYKVIVGEDCCKDRKKETAIHAEKLQELRKQIKAKHDKLEVELALMSLDGKVEKIA